MTTCALVNDAGDVLRFQEFDDQPPALHPNKGVQWVVVDAGAPSAVIAAWRGKLLAENDAEQAKRLHPTDWVYIRKADTGAPVSVEVQEARDAIRALHDEREAWINDPERAADELVTMAGAPAWPV